MIIVGFESFLVEAAKLLAASVDDTLLLGSEEILPLDD
jgi:hypothetical protein